MTQRHPMFFDSDAPQGVAATAEQQAKAPRPEPRRPTWQEVRAMVEAARAAGTYNDRFETVCGGCGRWCDGHYAGRLGTCCVLTVGELAFLAAHAPQVLAGEVATARTAIGLVIEARPDLADPRPANVVQRKGGS